MPASAEFAGRQCDEGHGDNGYRLYRLGYGHFASHSKVTYVSGVTLPVITLPTYGTVTTDEKIEMDYIAIEFGGDE